MSRKKKKKKKPPKKRDEYVHSDRFNDFLKSNEKTINKLAEKFGEYHVNSLKIGFNEAKQRIINWIGNFDKINFSNYELPLKLLESIEFIKLFETICPRLAIYAKDKKLLGDPNSHITHLGEISESSYKITSYFNTEQNFAENMKNLLNDLANNQIARILHFDDFLNSGGQLKTIFKTLLGIPFLPNEINDEGDARTKLTAAQIAKLKNCEIHIFYYSAFDEGIEAVQNDLQQLGLTVKIYRHLPANLNDGAFGDKDDQENIKNGLSSYVVTRCAFMGTKYQALTEFYDILKNAGFHLLKVNETDWQDSKCHERALGYGNYCRLVITDFNVPSVTLTALWHGGDITINGHKIFWNELFPRRKKKLKKETAPKETEATMNVEDKIVQQIVTTSSEIEENMISPLQNSIKLFLTLSDEDKIKICSELGIDVDAFSDISKSERDEKIFQIINEKNLLPLMEQSIANLINKAL